MKFQDYVYQRPDVEAIKSKYAAFTESFKAAKDAKAQAKSDQQKAKINTHIKALLANDGVKNVIDNSVSAEEAQAKLKSFITR